MSLPVRLPSDVQNYRQTWSANVHLLWDILTATPPQEAMDIFGPGLMKDNTLHADSSAPDLESELIRSAGVSGHKTLAEDTDAPPEQVLQPTPPDLSALLGDPTMEFTENEKCEQRFSTTTGLWTVH
ncbi:hypothetical protein BJX99DRAFT_242852 [Aspergillus californicus]